MKCIACDEKAEYVLVYTLPISITSSFTYGGSYCRKHFLESNEKAQEWLAGLLSETHVQFSEKMKAIEQSLEKLKEKS